MYSTKCGASVLSVVESSSHAAQLGCLQLQPTSTCESSDFQQVWREGEDDSFYHQRSLAFGFLCFGLITLCSEGVGASIVEAVL